MQIENMDPLSQAQIEIFQIIVFIMVFQSIILSIFASFGFVRFFQRRKQGYISLYYALINIAFLFSTTTINIGVVDALVNNTKTDVYYWSLLGMNIGIILASFFLYMFYSEMRDRPKKYRYLTAIVAFAIILFQLLPQNQWFSEEPGFKLKYISYLFQTLYCALIYITAARGFNYLRIKVTAQSQDFRNIMIAFILLVAFFFLMLMRAFLPAENPILPTIQIGSWIIQVLSIVLLFLGFIVPSLRKHAPKKTNISIEESEPITTAQSEENNNDR